MSNIHPTAVIDPAAKLGEGVNVGPYTVIGPNVSIGDHTTIGAHCVIEGVTTIGKNNRIWQFCSLGAAPQDMKYANESTELIIGDDNTIREFCTFNTGTVQDKGVTKIGNKNWIMAYVHIAHDCILGNHLILANNATLGGHVHLEDWVFIGGLTGVHQFVKVGAHAMAGFGSAVAQDVPPFVTVDGNPLAVRGLNSEGLRRRGFDQTRILGIKQMYKSLYRQGLRLEEAKAVMAQLKDDQPALASDVDMMLNFINNSTRGIAR